MMNERKSNIELLRIVSMIMIVFHHYATHGGVYWNVSDGVNEWISTAMISFGKIGVDIFMIICGYFMVEQQFSWKRLLKLEIPVWFYSVLFGVLAYFVFGDETFFSWLEEEDYIIKSPMKRIHKVKTAVIVKDTIPDEKIEILMCR